MGDPGGPGEGRCERMEEKLKSIEVELEAPADFTSPDVLYEDLVKSIRKYHPSDDLGMVEKAYQIARDAHKDQKRKSGEPYIIHPLCVAIILRTWSWIRNPSSPGSSMMWWRIRC